MIIRIFFLLLLTLIPQTFFAQKSKKVCGEYIYYAPSTQSLEDAKYTALERAKIKALAEEFGTVISQSNSTVMTNENGKTNSRFFSLSGSEVKGEWIEDLGEPEYSISFEQNMLVVKCKICGRAREIQNNVANFVARVLKNGLEDKFESDNFRDGDNMYLMFQSPIDGYVAAYLIDETPTAFCLLPYQADSDGQQNVKHGERYVFFSPTAAKEDFHIIDQYMLSSGGSVESNQIYVIFSPNPFIKAVDNSTDNGLPRQLSHKDFTEWLSKCRKKDPEMGVKVFHITVKP